MYHDVHLAAGPPVLEPVVQQEHVRTVSFDGQSSRRGAARADDHRHFRQRRGQKGRFIAYFPPGGAGRRTSHRAGLSPVTPAQHRGPEAGVPESTGEIPHDRRLSGPAHGQGADADHRHRKPFGVEHLRVVHPVAEPDQDTQQQGQGQERTAHETYDRAAFVRVQEPGVHWSAFEDVRRAGFAMIRVRNPPVDQVQGAVHGLCAHAHGLSGGRTDLRALLRVFQQSQPFPCEFVAVAHDHAAPGSKQGRRAGPDVLGVGAEQDGDAACRGFQHVVAAERHQRGADEGHVRGGIHGREFAHGVQDDHVGLPGFRSARPRPVRERESRRLQHLLDLRDALEMPGRPDQLHSGMPCAHLAECRQYRPFLFHGPGTPGHDHRHGFGQAEITAQLLPWRPFLSGGEVELDVARHTHPSRGRAEGDVPFTVERVLDAHGGQQPQHLPEQRFHETVSRKAPVRHAAIDQGHGAIVGCRRLQHGRPEFSLQQDQRAGAYPAEHAVDDERRVEGRQAAGVGLWYVFPDIGQAGLRHGGDQHREPGMAFHESPDHGRQTGGFAHGSAVEPDNGPLFGGGDKRPLAEPLAHSPAVRDGQDCQNRRKQYGQYGE